MGVREDLSTEERAPMKALEREVKELRRANEDSQAGQRVLRPSGAQPPTQVLIDFVVRFRDTFGIEPICKFLQIAPSCYGCTPPDSATRNSTASTPNAIRN